MKYRVKMGDGSTIDFANLQALAKHYGELATAWRRIASRQATIREARFYEGKANAYDIMSWQLHHAEIIKDEAHGGV